MARDVDILEGFFIKDLPDQLKERLAKIDTQLQSISSKPLETPEPESPEDQGVNWPGVNWLRSFYDQLEKAADDENNEYAFIATDPTYREAIKSENASKWVIACN
jgi:hypothetical protein